MGIENVMIVFTKFYLYLRDHLKSFVSPLANLSSPELNGKEIQTPPRLRERNYVTISPFN